MTINLQTIQPFYCRSRTFAHSCTRPYAWKPGTTSAHRCHVLTTYPFLPIRKWRSSLQIGCSIHTTLKSITFLAYVSDTSVSHPASRPIITARWYPQTLALHPAFHDHHHHDDYVPQSQHYIGLHHASLCCLNVMFVGKANYRISMLNCWKVVNQPSCRHFGINSSAYEG